MAHRCEGAARAAAGEVPAHHGKGAIEFCTSSPFNHKIQGILTYDDININNKINLKEFYFYSIFKFDKFYNGYPKGKFGLGYTDVEKEECDIDVLVDGKYEQDLYNPTLKYRGSANQRVIDIKKSLKT